MNQSLHLLRHHGMHLCNVRVLAPLLLLVMLSAPLALRAQSTEAHEDREDTEDAEAAVVEVLPTQAPLVYIDCSRCDSSFIREEITFVNHVRDPNLAEVHVLITDQRTGGGGRRYTLFLTGGERFLGMDFRLTYTAASTATSAQEREGLTEMLKLGLASYASQTPLGEHLRVSYDRASGSTASAPIVDPWKSWTFEIYGGGNLNQESAQHNWNARYGANADRVTEEWKLRVRTYFNHNVRVIQRASGDIRSEQRRHGVTSYAIKSLGRHWGAGLFGNYTTNTFDNLRHSFTLRPAIEYSIFPYEEASRRQITFSYRVGYQAVDYIEETIFLQTRELLPSQALNASLRFRQPWGSLVGNVTGSHFLPGFENYRVSVDGSTSVYIGSGVSVEVGGSFQRINDQLFLPRGGASLEDILLQRTQLATSYRATGRVGLSYTFGSIFSNVGNPRL